MAMKDAKLKAEDYVRFRRAMISQQIIRKLSATAHLCKNETMAMDESNPKTLAKGEIITAM
jgi:hypothetical protein